MNFRIFSRLVKQGPVKIQVIKKSQIYGHRPNNLFLTNRSDHQYATYPVIPDLRFHLNPGDVLDVLEVVKANVLYRPSCIKVKRGTQEFYIMQTEYKRFIKIV